MEVNFNNLPQMIALMHNELIALKAQIAVKEQTKADNNDFLNLKQAAEFLDLSMQTVYTKVHRNEIPYLKTGRKLMFSKKELTEWLLSSRKKKGGENE
jgi:excisionase family DNA binding protein